MPAFSQGGVAGGDRPSLAYPDDLEAIQQNVDGINGVSAESEEVMGEVMGQITTALAQQHEVSPFEPDFTLTTRDSVIETQASTTEAFRSLLGWVAGVSLLVGGIGIMNIMLVSVTERTREIGLRQVLGARPRDVRLQFLLEAMILSLIGGLVGVMMGVGGSYLVALMMTIPMNP